MNKNLRYLAFALLAVLVSATASAQAWRGIGRLQGVVVDQDGKPIKGAKVTLRSVKGSDTGPEPIITDAKGRWAAGGLIGGEWHVDAEAEGFLVRKMSANVSELERLVPPLTVQLQPKPEEKPKPAEEPKEAILVGGVEISPEIAQAIEAGNNFIKEQKWKEASVEYEKAIVALPTNSALKFALARAYHGMGELPKAIVQLRDVYNADTGNVTAATLLVDMLLQNEQLDEAKKVLAAMPAGALADVDTILNIGIRFINNNDAEDAYKYFNDAVAAGPDVAAAYYYRGIAELQLKKMKEAKADLQKVIALAPDGTEAKDAKDLLAQMK